MGLILKLKQSVEENDINNNYKARYVELAKPAGGSIALVIYSLLGGINIDPDVKIKLSNIIATFICWISGEQIIHRMCIYFNLYEKPNAKNPLYRNLKTLSSLGTSIGTAIASLSTSLANRKLSISLYSMLMGFLIGISAFIVQQIAGEEFFLQDDAQLGTEGWTKYGKTALVMGASIGQLLGGIISFTQNSDIPTSMEQITLYSAIASVVSFFVVVFAVPLINHLTRNKNEKTSRGILVTEDRDAFNNNYVRTGITLGMAIGTILGAFLGSVIIPGLNTEVAIAIGASAFSIFAGISLGCYGQSMTSYFESFWGVSRNTQNSWSYATRSTSYYFSYIGIAVAYALCPGAALMHSAVIGSAVSSLIGWFAGLFIIWLARQIEPEETRFNATTLPWTQRISSGATKGAILGALCGLAISFLVGGPLGLAGWCVLIGALGGIIGGIKNTISDPVFYELTNKATSLFFDARKDTKKALNSNPILNRYSFFSNEINNDSNSELFNSDHIPRPFH